MDSVGLQTSVSDRPKDRPALSLIFGTIAVLLFAGFFQRTALVDHIPVWATALGAMSGCALGSWLSFRIYRKGPRQATARMVLALVGLPICGIFLGTYVARSAVETAAFAGVRTTSSEVLGGVVDKDTKWKDKAGVLIGTGGREIDVRVTPDVYSSLEPWRAPGRDCLRVPIETGRWGYRRAIVPNYLDHAWDTERFQMCPGYKGARPGPGDNSDPH